MTGRQANDSTRKYGLREVQAAVCRIAERKIAAVEASTPGEARERLLGDIEALDFLLRPGVLEGAIDKVGTA